MNTTAGCVVAVDQGTSSTKAIALDFEGRIVARQTIPIGQTFGKPGWVEQDAAEIADSVRAALTGVAAQLDDPIACVGVSSQRESVAAWTTSDSMPAGPLLSWQDRRTAAAASVLREHEAEIRSTTGLPLDPMFSALKARWILNSLGDDSRLTVGTVDSWILTTLTGDRRIEQGHASRTQLLDIEQAAWSERMLELFGIPRHVLPEVVESSAVSSTIRDLPGYEGVRVTGVLADSHAALFAHGEPGSAKVKVTYGTGSSVLGIDAARARTSPGLVDTIAWAAPSTTRAFEGNILSAGSTLTWLSRLLGASPAELASIAAPRPEGGAVDIVPAFAGLGAPWWDDAAVGVISGITLDTDRADLAWAALESIALQIEDVLAAAGLPPEAAVFADGGPTSNDRLMQLQADLSGRTVIRSDTVELSAVGAAHLAGLSAGVWSAADVAALPRPRTAFTPQTDTAAASDRIARWHGAVERARLSPSKVQAKEHQ